MHEIPIALKPMAEYAQFINYKLVDGINGKKNKKPYFPKGVDWQSNAELWQTAEQAIQTAKQLGTDYGVGFLFISKDPFFFLDIDNCLIDGDWSPLAYELMSTFAGAAIEISQSRTGLHIFGKYIGPEPLHTCKNESLGIELYTSKRFVALTGNSIIGSAGADMTSQLQSVINNYFTPRDVNPDSGNWTTEPVENYTGPEDDNELILKACNAVSVAGTFNRSATFKDIWTANEEVLNKSYPDNYGHRSYDGSQVDAALAQHLAFWTGKNCDRMLRIMRRSALKRDKWDREDYLYRTILFAVSVQKDVFSIPSMVTKSNLKGTQAQTSWAEQIRAQKLAESDDERLRSGHKYLSEAKFWIDSKDKSPDEIIQSITPTETIYDPYKIIEPQVVVGYQFLGVEQQIEFFKGCYYVQDAHRVFVPNGNFLRQDQFNATYGGYVFQLDDTGHKTTRKAWEAFTESQVIRYIKAETSCFRPKESPGTLIKENGQYLVNTYIPLNTTRVKGDPSPFLNHLKILLPDQRDQVILLSYLAACLQYKGTKFQWAPLIQGVEGNGKSLFTFCMRSAIGRKYTHMPRANEIDEKYNAWLFNKLFIGVEDIYTPKSKRETFEILKPMITSDELERRAMQTDQKMADLCCNFVFNSNHKDAITKTANDRRIAPFFTAQQNVPDLQRDGLTGDYFPKIYRWLKKQDGYAIVTDFLYSYQIPDMYNPAGDCHRAPETSATKEAIQNSMGTVEQEIFEAIEENRPGFAGGWISSMALSELLQRKRKDHMIPINKRRGLLENMGYVYHPGLTDGRANNTVSPDNGKPRLFIKVNNPDINLTIPKEITDAYQKAQTTALLS
jgi:primase-polymerase (primpol)-like protein